MIMKKEPFPGRAVTQVEIDNIITSELSQLRPRDFMYFMSLSTKYSKRNRNMNILPRHLPFMVECLKKFSVAAVRASDLATLIYSLQEVQESDKGAQEFLILMTVIVEKSLNGSKNKVFSAQGVSITLHGLEGISSDSLDA
jgi:hypothetical protein